MTAIFKYLFVILLLQFFSCKKSKVKELAIEDVEIRIISEQYKFDFFKKILKDTVNIFTRNYWGSLIYEKQFYNIKRPINTNKGIKFKSKVELISELAKKYKYLSLTNPIFNKSLNKAYIEVDYQEFSGVSLIYKKENKNWTFESQLGNWMR